MSASPAPAADWPLLLDCILSDQVAVSDIERRCAADPLFRLWLSRALERRAVR